MVKTKEWHKDRIKELKFQRDIKINKDNRLHLFLLASFSIIVVFFTYELSTTKRLFWITILGLLIIGLLFILPLTPKYKENKLIQNNFNSILNR
jgi:hypothetical protein